MSSARPLWYKDAIIYELKVRSFFDSDADGFGDFQGLTHKLDYLQDLGVTTLWLLPFYPSPLRDDGYDIADYMTVHPETGTIEDFRWFLKEAHRRSISVITELVLNHTSDQHPWFKRARKSPPGSRYRDFYVWSDDPTKYSDARIIFQDFETSNWTWDPVAGAYFWHRFYSHQPDLNFENPDVHKALFQVVDHWLELGVDGLRLDAVPYLYAREGTNCENLPETHTFLRKLRAHVDHKFKNRMLLAEANQWPEDAVAYFGNGDECHMAFHFPIMPRMFMALHMEDSYPILDILEQTPQVPDGCQWAVFLRNHDELTLEMVTEEERDYMVRAYARDARARINLGIRRRLAPLLGNNRRRIELMNALLFSMPGTPVIYYGDEIGMGDNVYLGDRDGVRTPMQWSPDRNAGFSRSNPQRLFRPPIVDPEYHYEAINVETQQANPSSLLWWTKRLIALRREFLAFGRGTLEPLRPANRRVLSFIRRYQDEVLLIVANLSRFTQYAELSLPSYAGWRPLELFGHSVFPTLTDRPYPITLGPHDFYWFSLRSPEASLGERRSLAPPAPLSSCEAKGTWDEVLVPGASPTFCVALGRFVQGQRWFRGKARRVKSVRILDRIALSKNEDSVRLLLLEVAYAEGEPETYVLPVEFSATAEGAQNVVCRLTVRSARGGRADTAGVVIDASRDPRVAQALVDVVSRKRSLKGEATVLVGVPQARLREVSPVGHVTTGARALGGEQTNTSYVVGDRVAVKLLRRAEEGDSVELEMLRQLSNQNFAHAPRILGHVELRSERASACVTLAVLQDFVQNQGTAWDLTVGAVQRFLEAAATRRDRRATAQFRLPTYLDRPAEAEASEPERLIGGFVADVRLLGKRTAELHLALAQGDAEAGFSPESNGSLAKRAFYQGLRNLSSRALEELKSSVGSVPAQALESAKSVVKRERAIRARFRPVLESDLGGLRIRCHSDLHLGQVLCTHGDFVMIDFDGEPGRSPADRRRKRSPLADVAGMLRSFHYAVQGVLLGELPGSPTRREDVPFLEFWADYWYAWVGNAFVGGYLEPLQASPLLPADPVKLATLLDVHLLEKALYELSYELNNRPNWVGIPLRGILSVLGTETPA